MTAAAATCTTSEAGRPVPGARFRGRNRAGWLHWSRACEIVAVDERLIPSHQARDRRLAADLVRIGTLAQRGAPR